MLTSALGAGPSPCSGAGPDIAGEHPGEVALVAKAADERDVGERKLRTQHEAPGLVDSQLREKFVGSDARAAPERPREVAGRQLAFRGDVGDRQVAGKPCPHDFLGSSLLPWRQSALLLAVTRAKIPISLGKVGEQAQSELIYKQLIICPLLFQGAQEDVRKRRQIGIAAITSPFERRDRLGIVLISELVKCAARNVILNGVKRTLEFALRIVAQVNDAHRSGTERSGISLATGEPA